MDVRKFIAELTDAADYAHQVSHVQAMEPRQAAYACPETEIPECVQSLLRRQNIHQFYTHQASAVDAVAGGRDVVIVTPTASGKTLCYNVSVAADLLARPSGRAMYLFPTKALAQDQLNTLRQWAECGQLKGVLFPATYDGDTPGHNRTKIRNSASVVLTNPDMLHVGILPYHAKWHAMLRNLRYIVLDEIHAYRGIFGSHVAGVLRRLLRLCEHYGSSPRIICCSATIANPVELAEGLTGRPMTLIDNDGAPRGRKYFVLWNPPVVGEGNVSRRSANVEAVELLGELVRRRAQTIVFTRARVVAELIYKYAREYLQHDGDLASRIRPYRGGYLPAERRQIEQELFSGRLLAVSSTNALELGIDVGSLDAAILVGFPGTICSTWQQAGRAGRSSQDSLVVLVGHNEPVDQYLMRHPEYLFAASAEHAVIDPRNPHILAGQLSCACFEKPLTGDDEGMFGPLTLPVADICVEDGQMRSIDGRYYWASGEFPARGVNLRTISPDTYAIANAARGNRVIGQVDGASAPELVYPNAVYLHEGDTYLVRRLDIEAKIATVEPCQVDYYTQPVISNSCRLDEPSERKVHLAGHLQYGPADVTWQTIGFRRIKYYTMEMLGQTELDLPAQTLSTAATAWVVADEARLAVSRAGCKPIEALLGMRNLMLATLPALAMCDRRDISGLVDSSNLAGPAVVVYDRYTGGLGFAQIGYELLDTWLEMCRGIVAECPCSGGCPSCVGLAGFGPTVSFDPNVAGAFPTPDKQATLVLLDAIKPIA